LYFKSINRLQAIAENNRASVLLPWLEAICGRVPSCSREVAASGAGATARQIVKLKNKLGEESMAMAENDAVNLLGERDLSAPRLLLIVAFILVAIDGYDLLNISFLVPLIAKELALAPNQIGQIFAAGLAGSMFGGMALGPLADRLGRRLVLTPSLAVAGVATLLCATADSFAALAAYRFVAGFALGGVLAAVIPLVAEHYPKEKRSAAVTIMFVGFPCGAVIGGALTSVLIHHDHGWRTLFIGAGMVTLAVVPLVFLLKESLASAGSPASIAGARTGRMSSVLALVAGGRLWATIFMMLGVFLMLLVSYLLNSWTPMIAAKSGMAPETAALSAVFLNLGAIVGGIGSTVLVRKYGLYGPVAAMIILGAGAVAVLGHLTQTSGLFFAGLFVAGILAIGGNQNSPAMAVNIFPQKIRATGAGWQFAAGRLGAIAGPLIGGQLLTWQVSSESLFVIVAVPTLLAALCYGAIQFVKPKELAGES
jgi:MFS transporter, AAHS family, 4-hydroxybenzoate transporter